MDLMRQVLQDYCTKKEHDLKEASRGLKIYFNLKLATQVDILFLVECAKKYGWNFYISVDFNGAVYALVYEPFLPSAA